jgi:hypothetical protein
MPAKAGMRAPAKSAATDVPVTAAVTMSAMLGGMSGVAAPEAQRIAAISRSPPPRRRISGKSSGLSAAESITRNPVIAATHATEMRTP